MIATEERPIIWTPTPKQAEVLSAPEREVLFGGSLGGSKTDCLIGCGISQVENPKHRALFLRKSFPQLRSAIERSHELFRPIGGVYNVQTSTWTFPSQAKVEFAFIDSDSDKFRYQGRNFNALLWDELCEWSTPDAYVWMLSRLRTTRDSGLRLEVRSSANPLGPGASWVKQRFQIPDDGGPSECVDLETGFHRKFIPARIEDNPHLLGSDYMRQLQALPTSQRRALLEGRWDSVAGAVFDEFSHDKHVCDPFPIPMGWTLHRGADDGFRAPFCALWLAHDRDGSDTIYICAEVYQAGMTPSDAAAAVLEIDRRLPRRGGGPGNPAAMIFENGEILRGNLDSAAWADIGTGGGSRGEQMNLAGCQWTPCSKGAGSIAAGVSAIHARLQLRSDGSPGLRIFRTCKNLIRELTGLVYDSRQIEAYDQACPDHAVSALRYALGFRELKAGRVRVM